MAQLGFGDFDVNKIETWPLVAKIVAGVIIIALIVTGGWYFVSSDQYDSWTNEINTETSLRKEFKDKAQQAVNLEAYKEQIVELESLLDAQLRQLPNSNEVANLLDDISFIAQDNGLTLASIKWEPEVQKEIYTELPMSINVTGTYEQLGSFAADTAALPRIVTIDKFALGRVDAKAKEAQNSELLEMKMTAKTFRYNADQAKARQAREEKRQQRQGGR